MKNTELYQSNLLDQLFLFAKNSQEISEYLSCEDRYLKEHIQENETVLDIGCGYGRHLCALESRIALGVGIDINMAHVKRANKLRKTKKLSFYVSDAEKYQSPLKYSSIISLYNTLGNIENKGAIANTIKNSVSEKGQIIVSVFSEQSIPYRLAMYQEMGLTRPTVSENKIVTEEGFCSWHFSKEALLTYFPGAEIVQCSEIGMIAHVK